MSSRLPVVGFPPRGAYPEPVASGGQRGYSVVLAASDSSDRCKAGADIVCLAGDNTAELAAVLDGATSSKTVLLLPGNYHINDNVGPGHEDVMISGLGAVLHCDDQSYAGLSFGYEKTAVFGLTLVSHYPRQQLLGLIADKCAAERVVFNGNNQYLSRAIYAGGRYSTIMGCHAYDIKETVAFTLNGLGSKAICNTTDQVYGGIAVYSPDCVAYANVLVGNSVLGAQVLQRGPGIVTGLGHNALIRANSISRFFSGMDVQGHNYEISGNMIRDIEHWGLYLDGDHGVVADNHITAYGQYHPFSAHSAGIATNGTDTRLKITGNLLRSTYADEGLEINGDRTYLSHNDLKGSGTTPVVIGAAASGTLYGAPNRV